jgi:hypothetical protein
MATSQPAADPEVFEDTDRHDIELTEADLLGTHEYGGVLFTGRRAADLDSDRVARKIGGEQAFELQTEWLDSVFYNRRITGGMDWHTVFRKATESDAYEVDYEADYETGDLTITVERT